MTTRKATLIIRYKAADGWKRAEAARSANGRIRPGYAVIDGTSKQVADYRYQVRYYDDRKVKYIPAGRDANKAETLRRQTEQRESVKAEAERVGVKVEADQTRSTLAGTAAEYIKDAEDQGHTEAAAQARSVTAEFIRIVRKTYVDEVTREDVLKFHAALRKRGCEDRTVANKDARARSWLRFAGMDKDKLPPKPRYEEKLPTIYTSDQISSSLGAADPYMGLVIGLALKCGLREQEIQFLTWADIDEANHVLQVRGKSEYGFKVKDSEQRELPIPDDLLADLKSWKANHKGSTLVLANGEGLPNTHLLRMLKRLAKREKLNCGHCEGCKSPLEECREWNLHKFRRTYGTTLLRNGVDLRTVQSLMGHADLDSTLRYLRPATGEELQSKINKVKW